MFHLKKKIKLDKINHTYLNICNKNKSSRIKALKLLKKEIKNNKILILDKADVYKKDHKIKHKYHSYIKMEIIKIHNKLITAMASWILHRTLILLWAKSTKIIIIFPKIFKINKFTKTMDKKSQNNNKIIWMNQW